MKTKYKASRALQSLVVLTLTGLTTGCLSIPGGSFPSGATRVEDPLVLQFRTEETQPTPTQWAAMPPMTQVGGASDPDNSEAESVIAMGQALSHHHASTASSHAPIGVMGEHVHKAGEWMLGYRFKNMYMNGNRDGNSRLKTSDVFARGYMVAPTSMKMEMHLFSLMHAPSDDVTLMAMVPYIQKSMKHKSRGVMGMRRRFTTRTRGIGDVKLSAIVKVCENEIHQLLLNGGISLPTGSISKKGHLANAAMGRMRLPYPMQLGSGTFDLLPGVTYLGHDDALGWGAQARAVARLGENRKDYQLGNEYGASVWCSYECAAWMSTSVRLDGQLWRNIDGFDSDVSARAVPTGDPHLRGGHRVDLLFGINLFGTDDTPVKGHRLAIEAGAPVYQHLDGPQLETDLIATIGWQYAF